MYLLSQINKNPAITTVIKRGIFGGGKGLLSSSLRNIKALLIYKTGSLGYLGVGDMSIGVEKTKCIGCLLENRRKSSRKVVQRIRTGGGVRGGGRKRNLLLDLPPPTHLRFKGGAYLHMQLSTVLSSF